MEFMPTDEIKESVAKQWKNKILTVQIECENVPDMRELRSDASTARTGFLAFITAAFKDITARVTHGESTPSQSANNPVLSAGSGTKRKLIELKNILRKLFEICKKLLIKFKS